jgi:hypothetical protein
VTVDDTVDKLLSMLTLGADVRVINVVYAGRVITELKGKFSGLNIIPSEQILVNCGALVNELRWTYLSDNVLYQDKKLVKQSNYDTETVSNNFRVLKDVNVYAFGVYSEKPATYINIDFKFHWKID